MSQNSEPFDKAQGRPKTQNSSPNGRTVRLKKPHACGGNEFTVIRESVIVILRCNNCGSIIRIPKDKYSKTVKRES